MNPPTKTFNEAQEARLREIVSEQLRTQMKDVVSEAISEYFADKGAIGQWVIVTTAKIVDSISVIGGGLYWMLTLAGFHR